MLSFAHFYILVLKVELLPKMMMLILFVLTAQISVRTEHTTVQRSMSCDMNHHHHHVCVCVFFCSSHKNTIKKPLPHACTHVIIHLFHSVYSSVSFLVCVAFLHF